MKIRVLGCYGGADKNHRLTSFLVNDFLVVDAGAVTSALDFEEQKKISHIYLSHIHMDHIASLPFLLDNIFGSRPEPVKIYGHKELIKHLKDHIFNDICWPDFSKLPNPENPTVEYIEVPVGEPFEINGLKLLPVWVDHLVTNAGLIITENGKSWVYPSDTGDTEQIWKIVNDLKDPRMIFLECSYPNKFKKLAEESFHLTPEGVEKQLGKLNKTIPTRIYHCKPSAIKKIETELTAIDHPDLEVLEQNKTYEI